MIGRLVIPLVIGGIAAWFILSLFAGVAGALP